MNEYEISLLRVRRGLLWMMASYVLLAGFCVCVSMMMTKEFGYMSDFDKLIRRCGALVCGLGFVGIQFVSLRYCRQCPAEVVRRGKTWVLASEVFYGLFCLALLVMVFVPLLRWSYGSEIFLATLLGWIAVWSFGISGWFWQYFLISLAREIKSSVGTVAGWGVILLFSVAGFCTMFFFGVMETDYFFCQVADILGLGEAAMYTAMISGFAFMGLYACLLAGLWWRSGRIRRVMLEQK